MLQKILSLNIWGWVERGKKLNYFQIHWAIDKIESLLTYHCSARDLQGPHF